MKKDFDCVEMKNRIQEQIIKEMEGLSLEERRARRQAAILSDPVLEQVWKTARRIQSPASKA
jgi:hypothetical protein